jgi:hypothetical protein
MTKISKKQRVLDAMKTNPNKTIQPYFAFKYLGEIRLAAVISSLKKDGHEITVEMCTGQNKFGDSVRYAKYKLVKEAE